jgi:Raf kinase inhibitor-like YbhB/YbcL family protein
MSKKQLASELVPGARTLKIESPAFAPGAGIPPRYTADGEGISPPLAWDRAPQEARELVLLVEDPDAPRAEPFVHWIAYHIDPAATAIPEGVPPPGRPGIPARMRQGPNTCGTSGWTPPSPPMRSGAHHYHFELFAVDNHLVLQEGATRDELVRAMAGHVIASGEVVGSYAR